MAHDDFLLRNIENVRSRISSSAKGAGRDPESITLIAVTKTVPVEQIQEAALAGLTVFGENRVQEAREKIPVLSSFRLPVRIEWHLIGHLQKNKAKYAVRLFNLIHSLDSQALAEELNAEAEKINKVQDTLIEVKLSPEETKQGLPKEELPELLTVVGTLRNLRVRGLMTVPPFSKKPEDARKYFRELRELRDRSAASGCRLPELSMGMSLDFGVAIEEGATMIRVGTALFGERNRTRGAGI